jgi:hypothetical protein
MLVRNGLTKSLIVLEEYLPWTEPKTPKLRFCYLGCFALLINSCAPASAADRDQGDDQARRDRDPHAQEIPGPMDIAYSGDTGHRFRGKLATCRSEATLGFHFTSGWPA